MEERQSTAEQGPSQALPSPLPDGQSTEGVQQANRDESVADAGLPPPPLMAPRKPPNRFGILLKSFMVALKKLWILLWKNMLLRGRAFISLIFQVLALGIILAILILGGPPFGALEPVDRTDPIDIPKQKMLEQFDAAFNGKEILYVANDPAGEGIINDLKVMWTSIKWTKANDDEEVIEKFSKAFVSRSDELKGAIVFEKAGTTGVKYKIRMSSGDKIDSNGGSSIGAFDDAPFRTDLLFAPGDSLGKGPRIGYMEDYLKTGILGLQLLIDETAIRRLAQPQTESRHGLKREIILRSFPYPKYYKPSNYNQDKKEGQNGSGFCTLFILFFLFSNAFLAMNIGSERETGVKELMKLCGYPAWMQWLAWYLIAFLVDLILLLFFLLMLGFVPTVVNVPYFKHASIATAIAILAPIPAILLTIHLVPKRFSPLMAMSLLPHGCFFVAFMFVHDFEAEQRGAKWSMLADSVPNIPTLNMGYCILMFLVDIVLYQSLAVYVEAILPSDFGVRKPAYYPIQPLISAIKTLRKKKNAVPSPSQMTVPPTESKAGGFEPPPGHDKLVGVEVRNLVKKFGKNKTAVNGVSLKMYDGEIFALLGHNGAGKTTLISMLTGLFAPTSGTAVVNGYDIKMNLDKVRQSLGLCPQHDMLFNNLTVMEHLRIFGQMKGQNPSLVKQEALGLLSIMNLAEKKDTVSKKLSGGQKRKLCLGMALIGGANVVILDEPTSGMDPEARRAIWDILLQVRGQRTILLTTHFMEEADVLGDRIGIMAEGQLQCCGSPSFLKSFYGTGYTLKMSLLPGADKHAILDIVQKSIPDATVKPINMPTEVFISLPTETTGSSALSSLFSALTEQKEEIRIESLGLSVASMDEIFVKVGELSEKAAVDHDHVTKAARSKSSVRTHHTHGSQKQKEVHIQVDPSQEPLESATISEVPTVSHPNSEVPPPVGAGDGKTVPPSATSSKSRRSKIFTRCGIICKSCGNICATILRQMLALVIKRFIITKRKIWFLIFQILFPVLMMLGAVLVLNERINTDTLPPSLKMSLKDYKNPRTLYMDVNNEIPNALRAIRNSKVEKVQRGDIKAKLEATAKSDIFYFRENHIVAGEISDTGDYIAWFNTIPLHAAPLTINLASNIRGQEMDPPFTIEMTNHPLRTRGALKMQVAMDLSGHRRGFLGPLAGFMVSALLVFAPFFVVLPTEERLNKSRQLQLMTGIHPLLYWLTYFLWDFLLLLLVSSLMVLIALALEDYKILSSHGGLGAIFLLVLAYGLTIIPLAYLISGLPKSVTGGVIILLIFLIVPVILGFIMAFIGPTSAIGFFTANIAPLTGMLLSFLFMGNTLEENGKCNVLGEAELKIICGISGAGSDLQSLQACCGQSNCRALGVTCFKPIPYLKWIAKEFYNGVTRVSIPGTGQVLVGLLVISLISLLLHIMFELGVVRCIKRLLTKGLNASDFLEQVDDEDVRIEEHRVAEMIATKNTSSDALVVDTLCKNYGGLSAVSKLTFGVHHGECFGLLGTNGAGKTTTFRMITGDELPSLGNVHGSRFTLKRNRRSLMSHIGYCPQFDAFVPYFTGKENLQLFARLRGVPWRQINKEADKLLENVGLTGSGNVQCRKYSGGMKRRLSAAIALIGNPALILLDEPTSGVDPVSRRQFWKVLESVKGHGQSIILTSHSMDECEALCARLGIMVNGQLQCIGGVQHLKHKFAQGYSLTLRLKSITDPQMQQYAMGLLGALNSEISEKFYPCMLKDQHETVLQYQIESTTLGWNVIYKNLEELKKSYGDIIEDYSVSETSLEEVFLAFSRKQYPPRDSKIPLCRRIWTCQY